VVPVAHLDRDVTAGEARMEALELGDLGDQVILERGRRGQVAERVLEWLKHVFEEIVHPSHRRHVA
jgi:hypothetical protein